MYCIFGKDIDGNEHPLVTGSEKECQERMEKEIKKIEKQKGIMVRTTILKQI